MTIGGFGGQGGHGLRPHAFITQKGPASETKMKRNQRKTYKCSNKAPQMILVLGLAIPKTATDYDSNCFTRIWTYLVRPCCSFMTLDSIIYVCRNLSFACIFALCLLHNMVLIFCMMT